MAPKAGSCNQYGALAAPASTNAKITTLARARSGIGTVWGLGAYSITDPAWTHRDLARITGPHETASGRDVARGAGVAAVRSTRRRLQGTHAVGLRTRPACAL